jgi:anti-sigma regulatory factor (Ser/Thr protein kinase)
LCLRLDHALDQPQQVGEAWAEEQLLGGFGVPHSPISAALARQRLCTLLSAQSIDPDLVDDVALVVSELVGNAVRHATGLPSGGLHVDWEIRPGVVEVAVTDGGGFSDPEARDPGVEAQSGRGLAIVDALAADWGVRRQGSVTTVWAALQQGSSSSPSMFGSGQAQLHSTG